VQIGYRLEYRDMGSPGKWQEDLAKTCRTEPMCKTLLAGEQYIALATA